MSKKFKSQAELSREYSELCVRAGHLQYQMKALQKDLDLVNETLFNLNIEALEAKKAEDAAKAEEDAKKAVEISTAEAVAEV